LGITLFDHIIFANDKLFSFRENNVENITGKLTNKKLQKKGGD
jgi:hypothetical protein